MEKASARLSLATGLITIKSKTAFAEVCVEMRMLRETNCLHLKITGNGYGRIRISLERYGSRAFAFWYNRIDRGAGKGLGNAKSVANKNRIKVTEGFWNDNDRAVCLSAFTPEEDLKRNVIKTVISSEGSAEMEIATKDDFNKKWQTEVRVCCGSGKDIKEAELNCEITEKESSTNFVKFLRETEEYWNEYWNDTRVILSQNEPEWAYVENLYVIQKYMMACGCGKDYPMTFNGGTFTWNYDIRQWGNPHHWNTHMVYGGTTGYINRPEMMEGYVNAYLNIKKQAEQFSEARGAKDGILISEMHDFNGRMLAYYGALTPASHIALIFWDYYRFEMDENFLKEKAYPFMKAAAEFYLKYAKEEDGVFHIYPAGVYECEFEEDFKDTLPDISTIKALFPACIRAAEILKIDEEKRNEWKEFLEKLTPYTYRKKYQERRSTCCRKR